jgi:predicted DNA-binding protein
MKAIAENPNIRITPRSKAALRALAKAEGKPMQKVLDEAIEQYSRDKFLDEVNAAYSALWNDPKLAKEEKAERALWDRAAGDGLNRE